MGIEVEHAIPILPSRDLQETLEFYARLGFENRGAPPEEWGYLIIGRGGVELHFLAAPETDPLTTASACHFSHRISTACFSSFAHRPICFFWSTGAVAIPAAGISGLSAVLGSCTIA